MNRVKYTLDRYEEDYAIFLQRDNEGVQKLIHRYELVEQLPEGAIVLINDQNPLQIQYLEEETKAQKAKVLAQINRLKK